MITMISPVMYFEWSEDYLITFSLSPAPYCCFCEIRQAPGSWSRCCWCQSPQGSRASLKITSKGSCRPWLHILLPTSLCSVSWMLSPPLSWWVANLAKSVSVSFCSLGFALFCTCLCISNSVLAILLEKSLLEASQRLGWRCLLPRKDVL